MTSGSPIRLVFCITELDLGGAERALTQLVLGLNRDEWEPHVICLGPSGHFVDVLKGEQIPVICLNARGIASLPRILIRLTQELRRLRPALVQTFLFHANLLGRVAARFAGIPHVVSGIRVADHRSRWYGRLDRWTNSLVTTNVCVSQGVADYSADVVGLARSKLRVIPNAVEIERFANAPPTDLRSLGIPDGSRTFIAIGRLERQKGMDLLIDAVALWKTIPDDVQILIVGDGHDRDSLQAQVAEHRLTDRVHFAGPRQDIPGLLKSACALVLASRWEGMPNVVLEAMATGRAVIATRVEGVPEIVRDRVSGLVVSPDSPADLRSALEWFAENPQFVESAGSESQRIVRESFTTEATCKAYTNVYRTLLSRK
ncbi:glycosyltransferase [Schlesneria paludicola]|uniref:glycosyltransferase n=1 Tax=Schlesneria paludicola TaxID=360056 RepID=UPI00029A3F66|nr:glycosyltransferase [Schlesneria paludicola]